MYARLQGADRVGEAHGDSWISTSSDDGTLYVLSCDSTGWSGSCGPLGSNLAIHRLIMDGHQIRGETVNRMTCPPSQYGHQGEVKYDADGQCRMWKGTGLLHLDGVLYLAVSRHGGMERTTGYVQDAVNASLVKSTDGGVTWERSEVENYLDPMFPRQAFPTPCFLQYGRPIEGSKSGDWPHDGENYVYAVSNDGYWNNGNRMVLGRVERAKISRLKASDWQWLRSRGADGATPSAADWTSDPEDAAAIIAEDGQISQCGMYYLSPLRRYVLLQWFYPSPYKSTFDTTRTSWRFYESAAPWGPWRPFFSTEFPDVGYYDPELVADTIRPGADPDSCDATILTAGDWKTHGSPEGHYRLHLMDVTFSTEVI